MKVIFLLPDHFLSLGQRKLLHCPPISYVDPLAPHWFPCPPRRDRRRPEVRVQELDKQEHWTFCLEYKYLSSRKYLFLIPLPLSLGTGGHPSCRSGHEKASTARCHRAVSPQWRQCSRKGWQGWGLGIALWPGQTPGPPTGPRSSWSGGSKGGEGTRQDRRQDGTKEMT